ncbi:hypothetical protein, partial [Bacteroides fragilis]|uniref:hypothetical protein n=1 Tax=Bacteroides fragilis TaxID=817 RepID=UPI0019D37292
GKERRSKERDKFITYNGGNKFGYRTFVEEHRGSFSSRGFVLFLGSCSGMFFCGDGDTSGICEELWMWWMSPLSW